MKKARLYIYRNLRTKGFSVRYRGIVIDRINSFLAEKVEFKVNEQGRQRVIKERQKNVHAFVIADKYNSISKFSKKLINNLKIITYNPYLDNSFICENKRIKTANKVLFTSGKCYLVE